MGLLTLVEDRPTPACVYNARVYFCATVAAFCAVMIGYDSAFIGGTIALSSFKSEFNWSQYSADEALLISENIVSLYQAGAFFGALFAYAAGHYLGRKMGLQVFSGIFVVGAGMMLGANGDRGLGLIYGGRVLAGIGVGGASNLTPIYISELSPPAIRGRLVGLYEMGWQVGGVVGFWINYGVSTTMPANHRQWIIPFAVQLIPAGLMFGGLFMIKESPRWLMSRGDRATALKNLCWIRKLPSDDIYMLEEVSSIDAALEQQQATVGLGFWQPFRALGNDRKVMYRFALGCSLFFWQNTSGINAINYYSPTVFKEIGVVGTNASLLTTGIFGVIKAAVTLVWLFFLIDNFGRRNLLMYGAFAGAICLYYVGAYIAVANPSANPSTTLSAGGKSAMAFFYLWTASYTPSWNAFAAASNWFFNFLVARFTAQMFKAMGWGVFIFFASLMMCSIVFVFFLVPETKGIPLESMDRLFSSELKAKDAHGIVLRELKEDEEAFRRNVEGSGIGLDKEGNEKSAHVEVV
ncbi:putative mfs quinate transporter protein [Botrytis fragariae]|uniref:Quinate transporter n=1 Tax=Botrytis fragariae TaxID=1964551 RepID=A0A8H6EDF3_9HELO|nr:putative mfs quinate transporter protein [Botrytis fragariae]KAF5868277.1 putative mfs quinate transporter protein [Botrytis fragariae]